MGVSSGVSTWGTLVTKGRLARMASCKVNTSVGTGAAGATGIGAGGMGGVEVPKGSATGAPYEAPIGSAAGAPYEALIGSATGAPYEEAGANAGVGVLFSLVKEKSK